ncbi:MAG TPA: EAL domain-containing protein, partial [Rhizomicrobium sp.]|nr:EAL domain-containing protein [Rhizomicrobium sp.]
MTNALIVAIYAMACAAVALALAAFGSLPLPIAALTGIVGFLFLSQIHAAFLRRRVRRDSERQIAGLKKNAKEFRAALIDTQSKIEDVRQAMEEKASAQSKKIVSELQVLESLMRDFAVKISTQAKVAAPAPEPVVHKHSPNTAQSYLNALGEPELLETIRASLEENRVDLYLQPIVSLPQRKLRFYEALSRLRADDGTIIMPAQYMKVAAPAGLMSVVDNLLLF